MRPALAAAVFFLAGCAGAGSSDCGPDWRAVGVRDGQLGAQPQSAYYASRCAVAVDHARYAEGWQEGLSRRPVPNW